MAGVSLKKLSCPNCGAPLKVGPSDVMVECRYCHQAIEVVRKAPPRDPPSGLNVVYVAAEPVSVGWWPLVALGGVLLLGAGSAAFAVRSQNAAAGRAGALPMMTGGEHLQWHVNGLVHPATVTDDATEDLVGPYRVLNEANVAIWVGAFDGATRERLWGGRPVRLR